jgi:hypothetical protein
MKTRLVGGLMTVTIALVLSACASDRFGGGHAGTGGSGSAAPGGTLIVAPGTGDSASNPGNIAGMGPAGKVSSPESVGGVMGSAGSTGGPR